MPIRLCQKCGLKVLIDESQAGTNPFYCQRCTTAMKGSAERTSLSAYAADAEPPPVRTPSPVRQTVQPLPSNPTPSPVAAGARPATVKVLCPYCKASFNGRIPQKPARGSCPVCQKELILLPDGDIRPAAGFDLAAWQAGKAAPPAPAEETGTRALMKKYAAPPPAPEPEPEPPPEPLPTADTDVTDDSSALPSWLDDGTSSRKAPSKPSPQPVPETDVALDVVQPPPPPQEEAARLEDLPPPPPPKPRTRPVQRAAPSAAALPAVQEAAPSSGASGVRKPVPARGTDRRQATGANVAPEPAEVAGPSGAGLALLAMLLLLIPLGTGGGLLAAREKLGGQSFVSGLGARWSRGLQALDRKLFPPDRPAPPAPEPPKPAEKAPEAPVQPTAEDRVRDEDEINKLWMEFKREERTFKQKSVGATEAEKAEYRSVETGLKKKQARIAELQARYQKLYGKSYHPQDQ